MLVYVFVLFGSFLGICLLLGMRLLLRQHGIRRFVRSIKKRLRSAEERGAVFAEATTPCHRSKPLVTAAILQKTRTLLRTAEKILLQGKIEEAERLFIQVLTIQPDAHDVRAQLAKLYLTSGREAKAEAMYREVVQYADDVSYHANLGLAFYHQGKYDEAYEAYRHALERDPKNPERVAALGRASMAAQHFEEATQHLEKATVSLARDTELLRLLAECYLQLNDKVSAEATYRRINKVEPYDQEIKEKMLALAQA